MKVKCFSSYHIQLFCKHKKQTNTKDVKKVKDLSLLYAFLIPPGGARRADVQLLSEHGGRVQGSFPEQTLSRVQRGTTVDFHRNQDSSLCLSRGTPEVWDGR